MNYLDYFTNDTIRPVWITKNEQFKGGYLKPGWMRIFNQGIKYIKNDIEKFRILDEKDPSKNSKAVTSTPAPSIRNTFKYVTNGLVFDGFPRSEWSVSNFTITPVKSS